MEKADYSEIANKLQPQAHEKPPIAAVDQLADELVATYQNPLYRPWYCKVIYALGLNAVRDLKGRAKDSKYPGRLFSKLAREAMQAKTARERNHG